MLSNTITIYTLTALIGLLISVALWWRRLAQEPAESTTPLLLIYFVGLVFAVVGAKGVYFLAEGLQICLSPNFDWNQKWLALATGKTVTGALLGGYLGVELAKKMLGYAKPTGDWFAAFVPLGLLLGRMGCFFQECCPGIVLPPVWYAMRDTHGVYRWPAVPVEALFNVAAIVTFLIFTRAGLFRGQHFHIYLIAYGLFRFLHEFLRATPSVVVGTSGYQIAAILLFALGVVRYSQRRSAYDCRGAISGGGGSSGW